MNTKSQDEALERLTDWVDRGKTSSFTLSGRAGTGKTYLTKEIIHSVLRRERVAVSAYTHKAVRVISGFTGVNGSTLHSLHGLRINYDLDSLDINKVKFEATGIPKFDRYDYIAIDEGSMVGEQMLALNNRRALQYNTRIIYVGDPLQLPPVTKDKKIRAKISPIFELPDSFELMDIVRQGNESPLRGVLEQLRTDIMNDGSNFLYNLRRKSSDIVNGQGYYSVKDDEFMNVVSSFFTSNKFKKDINFAKIGAYTNAKIDAWNNFIRKGLFDTPEIITVGDKLTGYQTIVDEFSQILTVNSNDYAVTKVIERISDAGFREFYTTLIELDTNRELTVNIVDHKDSSFINFIEKLRGLFRNAKFADRKDKGMKWKKYFLYKAMHLTMIGFELFDERTQIKGYVKKDLGYAYAVTTHKLQGSTIENILVDTKDICYYPRGGMIRNSDWNPQAIDTRNRLLYTAISRASKRAILLVK